MISELVAGQEAVVRTARSIFPLVEKANDEPTADLLTQRMQTHEKTAWMLRSLLESMALQSHRCLSAEANFRLRKLSACFLACGEQAPGCARPKQKRRGCCGAA
jgi:hypothetical protein